MYLFLIIPLLIVLIIVIFALITAGSIVRTIFSGFGFKRKNRWDNTNNTNKNRNYTAYEKRPKVFGPNEGEYVEYEEIKDK